MIGILTILAAVMVAAGAVLGVVLTVSLAVHRERRAGRRLTADSPDRLASGARTVTALGVRRASATWN